jgi:hypothetical protein
MEASKRQTIDQLLDTLIEPVHNELVAQGEPVPSTEQMKMVIKTQLKKDKYTPNEIFSLMETPMGKQLIAKTMIKGLASIGLKGNLVSTCVMAAVEEPGAAIGLATLQLFLGAPMVMLTPYVMLFALFWFFFLFSLSMQWIVRSKKGHERSRIFWDPEHDSKLFSNFSLFMWGSGLFLFFWTVTSVALGSSMLMLARTLAFALVPDSVMEVILR